jgi:RNA polymerase sigma-70 factor (ECF subfamily)
MIGLQQEEIIGKAVRGDPDALKMLVNNHKDMVFNLAFSIVRNREKAKDITQESFLKALENLHKFRNDSRFSTWLYRIVYNQSLQSIRTDKSIHHSGDELLEGYPADGRLPGDRNYDHLYRSIQCLEEKERSIITLFYLSEKSLKEIRKITGIKTATIKVILYRARKKLYHQLKPEYGTA